MIEDGLIDCWWIDEYYGMYNMLGLLVGVFVIKLGVIMVLID